MNIVLFIILVISLITSYLFYNNNIYLGDLAYNVSISYISAYIFYLLQIYFPRKIRFFKMKNIGNEKIYIIKKLTLENMGILIGNLNFIFNKENKDYNQKVYDYLKEIDIFLKPSRIVLYGKELTLYYAILNNIDEIDRLIEEIVILDYLPDNIQENLIKFKNNSFHEFIKGSKSLASGEYDHVDKNYGTGYQSANKDYIAREIQKTLEDYINKYSKLKTFKI